MPLKYSELLLLFKRDEGIAQRGSSATGGTNEFKHCMSIISDHHRLFLYATALKVPSEKVPSEKASAPVESGAT